jgi:hypothetical protein
MVSIKPGLDELAVIRHASDVETTYSTKSISAV